MMEWNVRDPAGQQGAAGMWDTLFRIGGAEETKLQLQQCPTTDQGSTQCQGAYLGLHLTPKSSAYLEGTWVWTADHDIEEANTRISVFSGRGILSESQGPVWMIGTACVLILHDVTVLELISSHSSRAPRYIPI